MIRVALDSNILIYAEIEPDSEKGVRAAELILRAARDGVLPAQVLGEFLRVVQRRFPGLFGQAIQRARLYRSVFITPPTTDLIIDKASELARAHRLQLWDCVVCAAAVEARAKVLLTEDMQDGRTLEGLRLINPFAVQNAQIVDEVLAD